MLTVSQRMTRELSPAEHLILKCVCDGQSNLAISESTLFSIKSVENSISRSAKVFGVSSSPSINLRVSLVVAYLTNYKKPDQNHTVSTDLDLALIND